MKTNEWHWARLKKDLLMDDPVVLYHLECGSFIIPANTIVWVLPSTRRTVVHITLNPELLVRNRYAYQYFRGVRYSSLLEPLE